MRYVIDRFEGNIAVCEDANLKRIEFDRALLPKDAKEGSVIEIDGNGKASIVIDEEREARIANKMKNIFKR